MSEDGSQHNRIFKCSPCGAEVKTGFMPIHLNASRTPTLTLGTFHGSALTFIPSFRPLLVFITLCISHNSRKSHFWKSAKTPKHRFFKYQWKGCFFHQVMLDFQHAKAISSDEPCPRFTSPWPHSSQHAHFISYESSCPCTTLSISPSAFLAPKH